MTHTSWLAAWGPLAQAGRCGRSAAALPALAQLPNQRGPARTLLVNVAADFRFIDRHAKTQHDAIDKVEITDDQRRI